MKNISCYLLDMDGTIHLSGTPIGGAIEAVSRLRKKSRVIFLTNNTSISKAAYVDKLNNMGFKAGEEDIYTAGDATMAYLKEYRNNKRIYLFGTDSLKTDFTKNGFILDEKNPEIVVIAYDTSFDYKKLSLACGFIRRGAPYLLTHPDKNCPSKDGDLPDVGSFAALIRVSTGKRPFIICGKPFKPIADAVKKLTKLPANEIAMVGDRVSTDMKFAQNNGFKAIFTLSGADKRADLKKLDKPVDLIIESIRDLG